MELVRNDAHSLLGEVSIDYHDRLCRHMVEDISWEIAANTFKENSGVGLRYNLIKVFEKSWGFLVQYKLYTEVLLEIFNLVIFANNVDRSDTVPLAQLDHHLR